MDAACSPVPSTAPHMFDRYTAATGYDELLCGPGDPRPFAVDLVDRLSRLGLGDLHCRQAAAEAALLQSGITFNVYDEGEATERIIPFDLIPRVIPSEDWVTVEAGLIQRITALNLFIGDIFHDRRIVEEGVIPPEFLLTGREKIWNACRYVTPPRNIYCHIAGIDLIRDADGRFMVLEDNLRCPSGVSYVLENRRVLKQTLPQSFESLNVRPVDSYPEQLLKSLQHIAPPGVDRPNVVVMSPGVYNSAYFEHAYLAQQMGVPLVTGSDLVVADGRVRSVTTRGLKRVDVIYRRVDDDFLDPTVFRKDSLLGVPGLFEVYRRGHLGLANAPGTGIADNKVVYAFVPDMIRFYLKQEPILPNVETFLCGQEKDRKHVLAHLDRLVVKPAHEAGGKGILIGPHASAAERAAMADAIRSNPNNYIAQPTLNLSTAPTLVQRPGGGVAVEARHIDLRPFILIGRDVQVLSGGLTRVALKKGSLIVNSSMGGGTKDTWVLASGPG